MGAGVLFSYTFCAPFFLLSGMEYKKEYLRRKTENENEEEQEKLSKPVNGEKRKTINGEDIIRSMRELNFEDYLPNIEFYNKKYKSTVKGVPEEEVDDDNEESLGSSAENESRF